MKRSLILFFILLWGVSQLRAQTYLRISTFKFGRSKTYDVYLYGPLEYKLKGDWRFHHQKVVAFSDSTVMLDNNREYRFDQIKSIRMHLGSHLIPPFQFVFIAGGIAFLPLNSLNNVINDTSPIYNEKAAYISAALLTTGILLKQLDIRRVRFNKKTDFKVISLDFQKLAPQ